MQRPDLSSTAQYIAWHARHTPEATAIVESDSHITYRRMAADLIVCVRALEGFAVKPRMLVGVETPGRYLHLLLMLACEVIGATTTSLTPDELSRDDDIARHCDVILASNVPAAAHLSQSVVVPPDWPAALAATPVHEEDLTLLDRAVAPDQVARIVRTSGTTGRPKAMPMSHATLQLRVVRNIDRVARDILPNPRFLCLYRPAVNSAYARVLGILQHGGTVLFVVEQYVCDLISAGTVNYAVFAAGDIERIVLHAKPPPAGHKLCVEVFGAAVGALLRQKIRQRLNARVTNKYSSNETNVISIVGDDGVGTLCPGAEVRIVDAAGRDKLQGEVGMIRVRTETMVHGYFNDPALTKSAFIDSWFQTSDIGTIPEPGKLIVLGRADDMLNIGGVKVAPSPIEARVKLIDGVCDAVVMSIASPNEVGILLVAVEIASDAPPANLLRQVGAILSQYVRHFEIMPMRWFPRTETGKVKRTEIEVAFRQRQVRDRSAVA